MDAQNFTVPLHDLVLDEVHTLAVTMNDTGTLVGELNGPVGHITLTIEMGPPADLDVDAHQINLLNFTESLARALRAELGMAGALRFLQPQARGDS